MVSTDSVTGSKSVAPISYDSEGESFDQGSSLTVCFERRIECCNLCHLNYHGNHCKLGVMIIEVIIGLGFEHYTFQIIETVVLSVVVLVTISQEH